MLAAEASWRPPPSLRIVAFLFVLIGVLGVTQTILHLLVFRSFQTEVVLPILFVCIGWGLLRWRNGWRRFALLSSWLYFVAACCVVLFSSLSLFFGGKWSTPTSVGPWTAGAWLAPTVGIGVGTLAFWMVNVLNRADIKWRFRNRQLAKQLDAIQRGSWNPLRWRFRLESLFLATIVAALVAFQCKKDENWYLRHHSRMVWGNGAAARSIEFGTRTSRLFTGPAMLTYVVLSTGETSQSYVRPAHNERGTDAELSADDGQRISLPGSAQLYEVVAGNIRSRDERVTQDDIDDFIALQPADWSLDALVAHAEWRREHPNMKRTGVETVQLASKSASESGD